MNRRAKKIAGLLYILPWIVGFLVFTVYPLLASFMYSVTDLSPLASKVSFVGLRNYIYMVTKDPDFYHSLKLTLLYTLVAVPGRVLFALMVALLLKAELRGINGFRTVFYLPSLFAGSVATAILWQFLFKREGPVNGLLSRLFGVGPVDWLGSPRVALVTLMFLPVWQFGSSMVLFLAALKQVPRELYEASKIDGASKIKVFFSITLPMISPVFLFNLVMQTIYGLQEFTSVFVITHGGPNKATYLFAYKIYEEAFGFFKMGYACALSVILFVIILIATFFLFRTSARWVYYESGEDTF